jgi:hypothetical protein
MNEFYLGILTSLVSAPLIYFAGRLLSPFLGPWGAYFNLIGCARRLQRAGINNIIPSRSDYRLLKGGETISNYLSHVSHSLIYIGFWHAKGIEMSNIRDVFITLLERGCSIELVLLDREVDDATVITIAKYLAISPQSLRHRVGEAWHYVAALKKDVSVRHADRLVIKSHTNAVYASCFIIDHQHSAAKLLVDIKIFGIGRENGFGLELVKSQDGNNLYDRFLQSFLKNFRGR